MKKILTLPQTSDKRPAVKAIVVWVIFFAATVTINLIIPFTFGLDLQVWTSSTEKSLLLMIIDYIGFFLVVPLIMAKGWKAFRKLSFVIPVILAAVSIMLFRAIPFIPSIVIVVFAYLHKRFDLSNLGFQSSGFKGDLIAILFLGSLGILQAISTTIFVNIAFANAFFIALFRLFGNPASTVENIFYFGFLTERIGKNFYRYLVPFLVGAMYTAHEISNPEYWYNGTSFPLIFIGVTIFAAVYLWRKSVVVIWLGDGLQRFLRVLLSGR